VWCEPAIDRRAAIGFAMTAGGTTLSAGQMENLFWGFQVQFVLVVLLATAACVALVYGRPAWAGVLATLATYTMASGVVVWIVLILLGVGRRLPARTLWAIALTGLVIGASYIAGYRTPVGHTRPVMAIGQPVQLISSLVHTSASLWPCFI